MEDKLNKCAINQPSVLYPILRKKINRSCSQKHSKFALQLSKWPYGFVNAVFFKSLIFSVLINKAMKDTVDCLLLCFFPIEQHFILEDTHTADRHMGVQKLFVIVAPRAGDFILNLKHSSFTKLIIFQALSVSKLMKKLT